MKPATPSRRRFLAGAAAAAVGGGWTLTAARGRPQPAATPAAPAPVPPPPAPLPAGLQLQQLGGHISVLSGAGGNIAVHVRNECVLVVDGGIPDRARDVVAVVAQLAPDTAPRQKWLVNTHYHFDHVGSNLPLAQTGFVVAGSAACRQRNTQRIVFDAFNVTLEPLPPLALQTLLVPDTGLELALPDRVRLLTFPPAHTDGDVVVVFEDDGILHTGDLLFSGMFPVIDRQVGGSLEGMIRATRRLLEMTDARTRIIPGHGPVGGRDDLRRSLEMLEQVRERLTPFARRGADVAEVVAARPLADLEPVWGRGVINAELFLRMAYPLD